MTSFIRRSVVWFLFIAIAFVSIFYLAGNSFAENRDVFIFLLAMAGALGVFIGIAGLVFGEAWQKNTPELLENRESKE